MSRRSDRVDPPLFRPFRNLCSSVTGWCGRAGRQTSSGWPLLHTHTHTHTCPSPLAVDHAEEHSELSETCNGCDLSVTRNGLPRSGGAIRTGCGDCGGLMRKGTTSAHVVHSSFVHHEVDSVSGTITVSPIHMTVARIVRQVYHEYREQLLSEYFRLMVSIMSKRRASTQMQSGGD